MDQETALAGAQGFLGCLSAVQLSHVAPLKAALHPGRSPLVTVSGHVTESSCVAQAGTDATSRERTHSFAGSICVSLPSRKHSLPIALKASDAAVMRHSPDGFFKLLPFNFQLPSPFVSGFTLPYACGTSRLTFLKFKITEIPH